MRGSFARAQLLEFRSPARLDGDRDRAAPARTGHRQGHHGHQGTPHGHVAGPGRHPDRARSVPGRRHLGGAPARRGNRAPPGDPDLLRRHRRHVDQSTPAGGAEPEHPAPRSSSPRRLRRAAPAGRRGGAATGAGGSGRSLHGALAGHLRDGHPVSGTFAVATQPGRSTSPTPTTGITTSLTTPPTSAPTSTPTSSPTSAPTPQAAGPSGAAIAAIVVGGLVLVALGGWAFRRRRTPQP